MYYGMPVRDVEQTEEPKLGCYWDFSLRSKYISEENHSKIICCLRMDLKLEKNWLIKIFQQFIDFQTKQSEIMMLKLVQKRMKWQISYLRGKFSSSILNAFA